VDKKKKKNKHGEKFPTNTGHVGSNQSITVNPYGSVDVGANPPKKTNFLAVFVRLTTLLSISLVFPRS